MLEPILEAPSPTVALDPAIFRTYDIRGIVGKTLTEENIFFIGKAVGSMLRDRGEKTISLARDGRCSSPVLAKALSAGIQSSGCDVIDIGMVPTPLLYYATHVFDWHSGIMLTGSHNPSDYNGLKIVVQSTALSEEEIKQIYFRIQQNHFYTGTGIKKECDIQNKYIDGVIQNIHLARPLSVVIDAGNGVTGKIAPRLFRALGCEVHELYCEIDGRFPHHHPDPSQAANLKDLAQTVIAKQADVGLAFDGDGDRLGAVTSQGAIVSSDRLLMLFAKTLLAESPGAKIIFDVKCTNNLAALVKANGGEPIMWKTGHSLIKAKLAESQAQLAGEMSGHIFFKDRWYGFDDALYAGARLLEILADEYQNSHEVFATIPHSHITPELIVPVAEEEKFNLIQQLIAHADFDDAIEMNTIDGLRVNFNNGWGLIRASNTTPCLILRFEAINETILKNIQTLFRNWILSLRPDLILPFG